jgi:hypothetical protein
MLARLNRDCASTRPAVTVGHTSHADQAAAPQRDRSRSASGIRSGRSAALPPVRGSFGAAFGAAIRRLAPSPRARRPRQAQPDRASILPKLLLPFWELSAQSTASVASSRFTMYLQCARSASPHSATLRLVRENPAILRTTVQQNVVRLDWEIDVVVRRDLPGALSPKNCASLRFVCARDS